MAASALPKPGSKYGPCVGDCSHKDCLLIRVQALSTCRFCWEPIGYETAFYTDPEDTSNCKLVHARCLEAEQ